MIKAALGLTLLLFIIFGGIIGAIIKLAAEHGDCEGNLRNRVNEIEWDMAMDESHLPHEQYHM